MSMRIQTNKTESLSRTIAGNPKAANQVSWQQLLQRKKPVKENIGSYQLKDGEIIQLCDKKTRPQKVKFSAEEDAHLLELVRQYGLNQWRTIASNFDHRTVRELRERYITYLAPDAGNRIDWTAEEDALLLSKYADLGPQWAKIALFFSRRTSGQVKRHMSKLQKKVVYNRETTMGRPADFYSDTFSMSLAEGAIAGTVDVNDPYHPTFIDPTDGKTYPLLGRNVDVGDVESAVSIWNGNIRFLPESERKQAIIDYRKNPKNFRPELASNNRSNGAKEGRISHYLPPL